MYAEIVFKNGVIWTADRLHPLAQAIAVTGEEIIFCGSNADACAYTGEKTQVHDLAGRFMMPAFIDGHCHYTLTADDICGVNLQGMNTPEAYLRAIGDKLAARPNAEFIRGGGFLEAVFPDVGPDKALLDAISLDIPIVIVSETYHSLWVNSKALAIAGINAHTPDPLNGRIERNSLGEPSGCLRETAQALVLECLPDWSVEEYKESILHFQNLAHRLGITGACDPWLDIHGQNATSALIELDDQRQIKMNLRGAILAAPALGQEQFPALNSRLNTLRRQGKHFQATTLKFFADGIFETKTALMLEPYAAAAGKGDNYYGEQNWNTSELQALFTTADKAHWQLHIHCIADGAVRQALDAFEHLQKTNGKRDSRHCIAHATACAAEDFPRFKALGVSVMLNTFWASRDKTWLMIADWIGHDRAERYLYPVESFFNAGAIVTNASDYPVTAWPNPLIGIETAVTRQPADNYHPWVFDYSNPVHQQVPWPEERTSVERMLEACTVNQAWANFMESYTGSIVPGKKADFIILNNNPLSVAAEDIGVITVHQTWFEGECVYRASSQPDIPATHDLTSC
ncbi:TPA: amidohydrolase [Kluyvera cryocrescens]|nr:amidohydrolase [Kluyvera cryocrescens]